MARRDPHHTSVCMVCYQGTWYADSVIELPREYGDNRPAFKTDPERWEAGQKAHLHGRPAGTENLKMIDRSALDSRFTPYYESGQRIEVTFYGSDKRAGTVSTSSGWRPVYLLMPRVDSRGSIYVLTGPEVRITRVKTPSGWRSLI